MTGTVSDITGVTQFDNEACTSVSVLSAYQPDMFATPQEQIQDIKDYFARPRLISRGVFTFGSYTNLYSGVFAANNTLLRTIFPQWDNRLAGAYGIRFTLNFKVQIAATSFHQGVLALGWQYAYNTSTTTAFGRGSNHYSITNLPHVKLDVSQDTMVELSVPFLYPMEFMEITSSNTAYNFDYGTLSLTPVLQSISVAGLSPASYDIYCHLSDIELFGVDVVNPSSITLQSGGDILSREVKKSGVVSGTLSNVSKIAGFVSKGIPSLSFIAGPAAWALDTAAGIAKYFGYSKPLVQEISSKVYRTDYGGESHVDMPMCGDSVGLFQGNTTTVSTNIGATDVDEMALRYVLSQWSQAVKGLVSTTNTHGSAIYAAPLSPSVFYFRAPATAPYCNIRFPSDSSALAGGNALFPTTLMTIASYFRQWRGTIKFRITFAKTKLHGGRYMITYNPGMTFQNAINNFGGSASGPEVVSSLQQPYGNSKIMDLKDGNVFEFEAAYAPPMPYLNFVSSSGSITIVCMDPLQATGTVTSTVPFVIEVCGGDDFELADYVGPYFINHPRGTVSVQSGGAVVKRTTVDPSASTMGESVTSLKQVIMHPNPIRFSATGTATTRVVVAPWFVDVNYNTTSTSLVVPNLANLQFEGSSASNLSQYYAFCKGGTDLHAYQTSRTVNLTASQVANEFRAGNALVGSLFRRPFVSSTPKVVQSDGLSLHVRCPAFQTAVRIPTHSYNDSFSASVEPSGVTPSTPYISHFTAVSCENISATAAVVTFQRAAGDDAMLAHFIGPVPVFVPNSTSTVALDRNAYVY